MRSIRAMKLAVLGLAVGLIACPAVFGQIVINEVVDDERAADSGALADTREFIELYNAGAAPVDISGWTIGSIALATGAPFATDTIPGGSIVAPGGYFVIGAAAVPNVNFTIAAADIFPDQNTIFELRNGATLVDAVGIETFRGVELANATQEQLDQIAAGQTVGPAARGGFWGQSISCNAIAPNVPQSLSRYLNGRDTNVNGRDFGMLPITPGTTNNIPQSPAHTVPNVDAQAVGTELGSSYYSSFVLPRVIDPTVSSSFNPNAIPVSPQGGKAIIAYDETGGGNASYSKELVNKFDIYAYIDTANLGVTTSDTAPQSEATVYGIGTTDAFFATPNSAGLLTGLPGGNIASSANGSTGLGWLIQRREIFNGGTPVTNTVLQLIDMNDGGDSVIADNDWQVKQSFDLTGTASGWHRLAVEYDPATGKVTARFDNGTFGFSTTGDYNNDGTVNAADYVVWRDNEGTNNALPNNSIAGPIGQAHYDQWVANFGKTGTTGLVGNFYVGYRENLPGAGNGPARPPTYDLFVGPGAGQIVGNVPEPSSVALAALGMLIVAVRRRIGR